MVEKQTRGPKGEGAVDPHEGGRFRARITIKGVSKSKVVSTRQEGRQQIRAWQNDSDSGRLVSGSKSKLLDVIEMWFKAGCKDHPDDKDLAISTIQGYRQKVEAYISHAPIANIKLDSLTSDHIGEFTRSLADGSFAEAKAKKLTKELAGISLTDIYQHPKRTQIEARMPKITRYSISIQRQCYAVIRDALRFAVAKKLVSRNVALDYKAPGAKTNAARDAGFGGIADEKHGYELTDPDRYRLLDKINGHSDPRMKLRWTLAMTYGIRPGEALGICFGDIDHTNKELTIRRQVQPLTGAGTVIVPRVKTPSGKRTVPLHDDTLRLFRRVERMKHGEKKSPNWEQYTFEGRAFDLVFTQKNGRCVSQRLDAENWADLLVTAKVPHVRRYVARHDAASQMMAKPGVDHIAVSSILGHSDPAFTWKKYSHALNDKKRNVIDAIGASGAESVFQWKETLEAEHGRQWMIDNHITPNQWDEDGEFVS